LNNAETGIGTYGVNAGSQRYYGHDADAMSAVEAARIAAVLPLPKKRGAIAPKGFTRHYGNMIVERIPTVAGQGLDACIYRGIAAPPNKAPPKVTAKPRPLPGEEYETTQPPPPAEDMDEAPPPNSVAPANAPQPEPVTPTNSTETLPPAEQSAEAANGV